MSKVVGFKNKRFSNLKRYLVAFFVIISVFIAVMLGDYPFPPPSFPPTGVTETRYMRGDQHTVNGLLAYVLNTSQSDSAQDDYKSSSTYGVTGYVGSRVWARDTNGNEHTELTSGTPVATVSRSGTGEDIQSNTWSCPETTVNSTDAIVVKIYIKLGTGGWVYTQRFITEQLGAETIDSNTWTFYYYTKWEGAPFPTAYTRMRFKYGTSTYNSRITGFKWTEAGPPPDPPDWNLVGHNTTLCAKTCLFYANWSGSPTHFNFSYWEEGNGWNNSTTLQSISGTWSNLTKRLWGDNVGLHPSYDQIKYVFHANNSDGWNSTDVQLFTLTAIHYGSITTKNVDSFQNVTQEWTVHGVEPWLNNSDYPTSYIEATAENQTIGEFHFENLTTYKTAVDTQIEINHTDGYIILSYYDDKGEWRNISVSGNADWVLETYDVKFLYSPLYVNEFKIKLYSGASAASGYAKVDYVSLKFRVYTMTEMISRVFDTTYVRRINDTFPWIRCYDEGRREFHSVTSYKCREELLAAIFLYALTNNETFLDAAKLSAAYLNSTHVKNLWGSWNISSETWINTLIPDTVISLPLYSLTQLAETDSTYKPLLQEAVNFFISNFVKETTNMIIQETNRTGHPTETEVLITTQAACAAGLCYAGYILDNVTVKDLAVDILLAYPLGTKNLPYHSANSNTGAGITENCKTTSVGSWLLAASHIYYLTNNVTVKNTWQTVVENTAHWCWNDTQGEVEQISGETRENTTGFDGQFEYQTNVNTGATYCEGMVKGKWYLMEALIHSYLLFNNQSFLDKIATELHFSFINGTDRAGCTPLTRTNYGSHLCHDLPYHGGESAGFAICNNPDNFQDSDPKRTSVSSRVLQLLYSLNKTANFDCQHLSGQVQSYHLSKWLDTYNRVYWGTFGCHYSDFGIVTRIGNAYTLAFDLKSSLQLEMFFRYFMNQTDDSYIINNYNDIYLKWGNPFTGQKPTFTALTANCWNEVDLWPVDYNKTFSQVNASLCYNNINYTYFTVEWSNGTQLGFKYGEQWNINVTISDDAVTIYIWALEAGSWSHHYG